MLTSVAFVLFFSAVFACPKTEQECYRYRQSYTASNIEKKWASGFGEKSIKTAACQATKDDDSAVQAILNTPKTNQIASDSSPDAAFSYFETKVKCYCTGIEAPASETDEKEYIEPVAFALRNPKAMCTPCGDDMCSMSHIVLAPLPPAVQLLPFNRILPPRVVVVDLLSRLMPTLECDVLGLRFTDMFPNKGSEITLWVMYGTAVTPSLAEPLGRAGVSPAVIQDMPEPSDNSTVLPEKLLPFIAQEHDHVIVVTGAEKDYETRLLQAIKGDLAYLVDEVLILPHGPHPNRKCASGDGGHLPGETAVLEQVAKEISALRKLKIRAHGIV